MTKPAVSDTAAHYSPEAILDRAGARKTGDVALKMFFRIAEEWGVDRNGQRILLGQPPRSTFFNWLKAGGEISRDTLERISYIVGIATALQILLPAEQSAGWLTRPNAAFGGTPPIQRMLAGNVADLATVRAYLDAQRGW